LKKAIPFLFFLFSIGAHAQDTQNIVVKGCVYDIHDSSNAIVPIVVNKRTGMGMSCAPGAVFSLSGLRSDTFQISSGGYEMVRICFLDSTAKQSYFVRIGLSMKENYLSSVIIHPVKDLGEIQRERQDIGVEQTRSTIGATDAFESPITFLYERYSRDGKSRAFVAMMENEDKKREILKELFRTYVKAGVIDLSEDQFDAFIDYLNIPESMLKGASDFELATYIRQKYIAYTNAENYHINNQR
jgi:hypothetical protein